METAYIAGIVVSGVVLMTLILANRGRLRRLGLHWGNRSFEADIDADSSGIAMTDSDVSDSSFTAHSTSGPVNIKKVNVDNSTIDIRQG